MAPRDLSGTLLGGRYRVGRPLGEGGMGAVYEAVQEDLGRKVAVKVLHAGLVFRDDAVARFRREAQAAAALGHPNIVQVTDFQEGPPAFLVMELLEGASLQDMVAARGALAAPRVVAIARQVLSALAAAHRAGLVHRDVKPDNVFLVNVAPLGEIVKLLDFGIVKHAGDPFAEKLTATGAMLGSPAFMAPEQVQGAVADVRTDLYAVGVCMYFALTGQLPFASVSLPKLVAAIETSDPTPLLRLAPAVNPWLAAIVTRAMAKRPEHRFQSADEMLAAFASPPRAAAPVMPGAAPPRTGSSLAGIVIAGGVALAVSLSLLGTVLSERSRMRHATPTDAGADAARDARAANAMDDAPDARVPGDAHEDAR